MKAVMITAPTSGSGKTTLTMGLLRALRSRGIDIGAFKTGPDYIDRAFLEEACGRRCGNLDMHLQGRNGMLQALSTNSTQYSIIEGAMGYFDGIYNTPVNSSYDISRALGINAILVYTPKGELFSAIPKLKGMAEFDASSIKAVIFNNVNENYYNMLKEAVEKHLDIKVLGYLPKMDKLALESRHLGLVQSIELEGIDAQLEALSRIISDNIDIDGILGMMTELAEVTVPEIRKYDIKVAVARDKAFSFYYTENLDMLEKACQVSYFSPLEDKELPECDLLYLGGGYPEVFMGKLAENSSMRCAIKRFSDNGGFIYAECGGFMYLTEDIDGTPMTGVFKGRSMLTGKLQNFGYVDMAIKEDCMLGKQGDTITGHEFHKSVTETSETPVLDISKTMGRSAWEGGYIYKNTYGGYPHISFIGNMHVLENILKVIERSKSYEGCNHCRPWKQVGGCKTDI